MGNEHTDLGDPTVRPHQPRLPARHAPLQRTVDNCCRRVPGRGRARGRRRRRRPERQEGGLLELGRGADRRWPPGGYLARLLRHGRCRPGGQHGAVRPTRRPWRDGRARSARRAGDQRRWSSGDCRPPTCAYTRYLQGTSMASPHVAGVAALVVARYGVEDERHGGLTLNPARVQRILERTARRAVVPGAEPVRLPGPGAGRCVHRELRGRHGAQRLLRPRRRERPQRGQHAPVGRARGGRGACPCAPRRAAVACRRRSVRPAARPGAASPRARPAWRPARRGRSARTCGRRAPTWPRARRRRRRARRSCPPR